MLVAGAVALLPLVACDPTDPVVERISETESDGVANGNSSAPAISNIGGAHSDDGLADVFLHDRATGGGRTR